MFPFASVLKFKLPRAGVHGPPQSRPTVPSAATRVSNQARLLPDFPKLLAFVQVAPHTSNAFPSSLSLLRSFSIFRDLPKPPRLLPACLQRSVSECLRPHDPGCAFGSLAVLELFGWRLFVFLVNWSAAPVSRAVPAPVAAPATPEPVPGSWLELTPPWPGPSIVDR